MTLSKEKVAHVAKLARLHMTDAELDKYGPQINNILKFVEQLGELNTDNVAPLPSPVDIALPLRKDGVTDGDCADKVLANAPEQLEGFFVVPKVVE
jgi:aspartyl-tRNA(Asn)/glutamyl-tRNA(Gln) amidotransferase subunit C